ncbi:MAG: glutamate racemase [Polaromonas sp. 39-63-25]|nr:MAG: glutamate racemase [Polaromonas sp. 35-63-35]OYZ20133.1 MAG: glutamate racemase [Polaromonas sp. 16-63-31]OYZ77886.1 MAG: glutamate racemase [Polaromonas sp. 24-63-21]OZA49396.1 MAG: glutamate racemase [Polaromonas sp. 17-63-33]OZA87471.1 MAG: glutamate racemase [Polaromonas sp. 39-63-25]
MLRPDAPIGVFDSGVGGLSILRALRTALPQEDFVYFADTGHAPYGERDDAFVAQRSLAIAGQLRQEHAIKALVVACNTATAAAVHLLRAAHAGLPLVGVEPALKPAAARSSTKRIAVLATRATLASAKFAALHASLHGQAEFVLQPCAGLAAAIEADDATEIRALCSEYIGSADRFGSQNGQIDTLVMGCTHYPFAAPHFAELAGPEVALIETGEPVAHQTRRLLQDAGLLNPQGGGRVQWLATGDARAVQAAAARWLGL